VNQPDKHVLGPVTVQTSFGPVEYTVELSVGEIDTAATHSVVVMTAVIRGETAIATLHHVDRIEIKDVVDTEVEEDLRDD
jgi:hypothetical protein